MTTFLFLLYICMSFLAGMLCCMFLMRIDFNEKLREYNAHLKRRSKEYEEQEERFERHVVQLRGEIRQKEAEASDLRHKCRMLTDDSKRCSDLADRMITSRTHFQRTLNALIDGMKTRMETETKELRCFLSSLNEIKEKKDQQRTG